MPPIKKIVLWLVVIFLLYAIITSPNDAASIFSSAWDVVSNGVRNIAAFFDRLSRGRRGAGPPPRPGAGALPRGG